MIRRKEQAAVDLITLRTRRMQDNLKTLRLEALLVQMGSHKKRTDGNPGVWKASKQAQPECGAKTRQGSPCKAKAVAGSERCRLHGGLSTGAKTEAGRAAIVASNQRRGAAIRAAKQSQLG